MKTSRAQTTKRILLFSTAVIASCLLSIMVPRASVRDNALPVISQDEWNIIDKAEPESSLGVEDWMLNFNNE